MTQEGGKKKKIEQGTRRQVWNGTAEKSGSMTKTMLKKNKHGEIVSKKKSKAGKELSPYMSFCKKMRPVVIEESEKELSFGQIGKELGKRWRALSEKEKEEYSKKK